MVVWFGVFFWLRFFLFGKKKNKKKKTRVGLEGLLTKEMAFPPFLLKVLWGKNKNIKEIVEMTRRITQTISMEVFHFLINLAELICELAGLRPSSWSYFNKTALIMQNKMWKAGFFFVVVYGFAFFLNGGHVFVLGTDTCKAENY